MYCSECRTDKKVHNGLCQTCAQNLRAEIEEYKHAPPGCAPAKRWSTIRAALQDFESPVELDWKDRAVYKLLNSELYRSWA